MELFHLIWYQWRRRWSRTLLSVISVSIAVAAVLSTTLAQSSVRASYQLMLSTVTGQPALEILGATGGTFPEAEIPPLDEISPAESVFPSLTRPTLARFRGRRFRTMLLGLPAEEKAAGWETFRFVAGGPPSKENEAVVGDDLARSLEMSVGDRLIVITRRGPRSVYVSGLATTASFRDMAPGSSLAVSLPSVQAWFAQEGELSRVRLVFSSRHERDRARGRLATALPEILTVQVAHDHAELADNILRSTELAVRFAGALSVVLATFIIINTLRMNFGERRKDLAIVRVLGATTRQIVGMHLVEGAGLGLLSILGGIPAGIVMGRLLSRGMQAILEVDLPVPEIAWSTIWMLAPLGPLIGCLGAVVPALAARHVSPNEALGETDFRRGERFPYWSIVAAATAWCGAVSLLLLVIFERIPPELAVPAGLLMLAAFVVIIPALLLPLLRAAAWLATPVAGIENQLAIEQLLRRPTRTGLTVGACVVAVSSGLGLGSAVGNHVEAIHQWQRRTMAGDVVLLDPSAAEEVGTAVERESLQQSLRENPLIRRVDPQRHVASRVNGMLTLCVMRELHDDDPLPWNVPPRKDAELREAFAAGDLVLGNLVARQARTRPGDSVRLEVRGQTFPLRVAAVVDDYHLDGMVAFLSTSWATDNLLLGPPDAYILHLQEPSRVDEVVEQLQPLEQSEGILVESFGDLRRRQDRIIQGITGGLWTLFAVGFVVSGIGVANTLTMNILEQRRELGLLRILGMTRRQTGQLVLWEALSIGLVGSLLGAAAGATTAWVIHLCNEPLLGRTVPFSIPLPLLVSNLVGCWLIAVVAAWLPGRVVQRLNLLEAIAED